MTVSPMSLYQFVVIVIVLLPVVVLVAAVVAVVVVVVAVVVVAVADEIAVEVVVEVVVRSPRSTGGIGILQGSPGRTHCCRRNLRSQKEDRTCSDAHAASLPPVRNAEVRAGVMAGFPATAAVTSVTNPGKIIRILNWPPCLS